MLSRYLKDTQVSWIGRQVLSPSYCFRFRNGRRNICMPRTFSNSRLIGLIVNRDYRGLKKLISAIRKEHEAAGAQSSKTPKRKPAGSPESLYREPFSSQLARTPSSQHHRRGRTVGFTPQRALYGSSGQTPPLSKDLPSVENTSTLEPDGFVLALPARSYTNGNVIFPIRIPRFV